MVVIATKLTHGMSLKSSFRTSFLSCYINWSVAPLTPVWKGEYYDCGSFFVAESSIRIIQARVNVLEFRNSSLFF